MNNKYINGTNPCCEDCGNKFLEAQSSNKITRYVSSNNLIYQSLKP